MKIEALKLFLSGTERFEPGDIRTVDDDRGAHFCERGWAKPVGGDAVDAAPGEATIKPHSTRHAQEVKHG
jgi:hypothetical protein